MDKSDPLEVKDYIEAFCEAYGIDPKGEFANRIRRVSVDADINDGAVFCTVEIMADQHLLDIGPKNAGGTG